jgi:hypothetical protein
VPLRPGSVSALTVERIHEIQSHAEIEHLTISMRSRALFLQHEPYITVGANMNANNRAINIESWIRGVTEHDTNVRM